MEEFPNRLRQMRERRGMTRKKLSECCGVSKNMISRYERGERVPDLYTAREIAEFFDITLDDLAKK